MLFFFVLRIRRPPRSTRPDTLFPYTTLFRSPSQTAFASMLAPTVLIGGVHRFCARHKSPVGASLLAITASHSASPVQTDRFREQARSHRGSPIEQLAGVGRAGLGQLFRADRHDSGQGFANSRQMHRTVALSEIGRAHV